MSQFKKKMVVGYLLFRGMQIENANALSGNLLYGTPALTGIKGTFHAMSRKLLSDDTTASIGAGLRGVLIACHEYRMYHSRGESFREYHFTQQKPSPSTSGDLTKMAVGTLPSIIQQAQCFVSMSFVVEVVAEKKLTTEDKEVLTKKAFQQIQHQRLAGGSVRPFSNKSRVKFIEVADLNSLPYELPLCNVLVDASDVMQSLLDKDPSLTATDVLIDISSVHHTPSKDIDGNNRWTAERTTSKYGWIVPLMVGYHGISPLYKAGKLENSRSNKVGSQYVESVYSLGRWANPHKLQLEGKLNTAFWYYNYEPEKSLYLISSTQPSN